MMNSMAIKIGTREISTNSPSYFIADLAANHDGDLARAKDLIYLAKEAGADAIKFQHFKAESIVSDRAFRDLGSQFSHQAKWSRSVFDTYRHYEFKREWNDTLITLSKKIGIEFLTTPYDYEAINELDDYLPAYKIGSGDITWIDFLEFIAKKNKPILLACGASSMSDVERAMAAIQRMNNQIVLMQCNTNYTSSVENFKYINLNVLNTFSKRFPEVILGLSDHTSGHSTVLGAIALGARVIEKHFTDDNKRSGPDHLFSMNPITWKEMILRTRELEFAMGDGVKIVEENEKETVILQRRSVCSARDLSAGESISRRDLDVLRPAPIGCYEPYEINKLIGRRLKRDIVRGKSITSEDLA